MTPDPAADERARVAEANAVYKGAQVLAGHFALRPWIDMAADRGDLRRLVRDRGYDPNEPTRDDCQSAFADALRAYKDHHR